MTAIDVVVRWYTFPCSVVPRAKIMVMALHPPVVRPFCVVTDPRFPAAGAGAASEKGRASIINEAGERIVRYVSTAERERDRNSKTKSNATLKRLCDQESEKT